MKKIKKLNGKRLSMKVSRRAAPRIDGAPAAKLPRIGLEATTEHVVRHEWTIQMIDPRLPAVFSTPSMIGLMEHAIVLAVRSELPPGAISVGTRVEVDHLKAIGPGATVAASARLVKYQGRFMVFAVEARSGGELIGRGRVFHAIVEPEKHGDKALARSRQQTTASESGQSELRDRKKIN